ncbi:MAG: DASH family cryptochrome [Pricia sp.]
MNNVILWFKNDLRLTDNETLVKATAKGNKILPVYIFDPKLYQSLDLKFPKTDLVRFEFILQCVKDLKTNLAKIGGNLMILVGEPEILIPELVRKHSCSSIFAEQEFATEELNQIKKIKLALPSDCTFDFTWGRTLYHLEDIPYEIPEIPLTSKAYRINTTKNTEVRKTLPIPAKIDVVDLDTIDWGDFPTPNDVGFTKTKDYALTYVSGGESKALERLDYYLFESEQLTSYRWTRNRSLGMEYSSKFSPYIALGCLSPRTIYEAVKKYEKEITKNQSTWWMIFEIVWRDYFTFKLMRFQNEIYSTEGYTDKTKEFTNDPQLFKRWCNGKTGIPFVDAHMRQLNETGYMSNRGRVNCSSFLVYDYKVDWTWGAAYFESKLIDYDVGSNWMNWHTQAYQIWYTNPVNQANKYKAQEFIRKWIPELGKLNDLEVLIPWECSVDGYPKPVEIFSKWSRAINKIKKITIK